MVTSSLGHMVTWSHRHMVTWVLEWHGHLVSCPGSLVQSSLTGKNCESISARLKSKKRERFIIASRRHTSATAAPHLPSPRQRSSFLFTKPCQNISLCQTMPKYFALPNHAKIVYYYAKIFRCANHAEIFRSVLTCQNISLCQAMPKYFTVSYHAKIFRSVIPCQNIWLCHTMPKYLALPNHAKIFRSVIPCQNIWLCPTMPKY